MVKVDITRGFARALDSYPENATIQKQVSDKLFQLINNYVSAKYQDILEIGCGTGFLTSNLLSVFHDSNWTINDLNPNVKASIDTLFKKQLAQSPQYLFGDAEILNFYKQYDLVVSSSCFQWFCNLPCFFYSISNSFAKNGLFAFSTFGPQNMSEIKMVGGHGLKYFNKQQYISMLNPKYEVLSASEEILKIHFKTPSEVLKHIKATGVNGVFRQKWTKSNLTDFCIKYLKFADNDGYPLTYHPMYFICKPL